MPRDTGHFDTLARLLTLERDAQRERLALDRGTLPLSELEALGRVVLDVETVEESIGLSGRVLVTLKREDRRALTTRLGPGDLVTVSPRKAEVDEPPTATVTRASRSAITLAFDRPPPAWMGEGRLRLDITANDVTFERARKTLKRVADLDQGQARDRREVLLGNAPARFDPPVAFAPSQPLNPEQLDAVTLALSARDFALVHGPPGTGKSTVLSEVAVQLVRKGKRLLCTAASNAAVDHLLELCLDRGLKAVRVGHPARVLPRLQEFTLDELVEAHPDRVVARTLFDEAFDLLGYARKQRTRGRSRTRFSNAREASAEARKLMDEARALERRAVASVLDGAQVVCATCAMLGGSTLDKQSFDVALHDEATQAVEPASLAAFLKAPTVILAGDHQQLPPTVLSQQAADAGLATSLFERLLKEHGGEVKRMLKEQHRMNEVLMAFPSRELYAGQLRAHPAVAHRTLADVLPEATLEAPALLFLDTAGKGFDEVADGGGGSLKNPGEAQLVVARARALLAAGLSPLELAVITPYRAQALLVRELLEDVADVEVDTVDAFQGREKDAVLVSLVRSNAEQQVGFLKDLRRTNVALTRARRHLFVVGDTATLSGHPFYARLVEYAHEVGAWRSAWEWSDAGPA